MVLTDQLHRKLQFHDVPKRIVSLVPSQTELVFDMGLGQNLVGITKFCVHPQQLRKEVTVVGGTKQINLEKLKALNPDLILCNKEENTEAIVNDCESIAQVHISDVVSISDCLKLIEQYGIIFNKNKEAQDLISLISHEQSEFEAFVENRDQLKVAYFIWKDPWMVAGGDTFINTMLTLNCFNNMFEDKGRYPEVDLAELEDLDLILLSSEPYPFKEDHILAMKQKYPKSTVLIVDGEMFSWYGSRLTKSFDYFKKLCHEI